MLAIVSNNFLPVRLFEISIVAYFIKAIRLYSLLAHNAHVPLFDAP